MNPQHHPAGSNPVVAAFFEELRALPLEHAEYQERFFDELADHIEDSMHDYHISGKQDLEAATDAVARLGSPKKLQKQFNTMLKEVSLQQWFILGIGIIVNTFAWTAAVYQWNFILEFIIQVRAVVNGTFVDFGISPIETIFPTVQVVIFTLVASLVASLLAYFAVLRQWMTTAMSHKGAWLLFGILISLPTVLCLFLLGYSLFQIITSNYLYTPLLGFRATPTNSALFLAQSILTTYILPIALQAALYFFSYRLVQVQLASPVKKKPSTHKTIARRIALALTGGYLLLLTLSLFLPMYHWLDQFSSAPNSVPVWIFGVLLIAPVMFLQGIQQFLLVSLSAGNADHPFTIILFGIVHSVVFIAALVYVMRYLLSREKQKSMLWIIPIIGTTSLLLLCGAPSALQYNLTTTQWSAPHQNITKTLLQSRYHFFAQFYTGILIMSEGGIVAAEYRNTQTLRMQNGLEDYAHITWQDSIIEDLTVEPIVIPGAEMEQFYNSSSITADDANRIECNGKNLLIKAQEETGDQVIATPLVCETLAIDGKIIFTQSAQAGVLQPAFEVLNIKISPDSSTAVIYGQNTSMNDSVYLVQLK